MLGAALVCEEVEVTVNHRVERLARDVRSGDVNAKRQMLDPHASRGRRTRRDRRVLRERPIRELPRDSPCGGESTAFPRLGCAVGCDEARSEMVLALSVDCRLEPVFDARDIDHEGPPTSVERRVALIMRVGTSGSAPEPAPAPNGNGRTEPQSRNRVYRTELSTQTRLRVRQTFG